MFDPSSQSHVCLQLTKNNCKNVIASLLTQPNVLCSLNSYFQVLVGLDNSTYVLRIFFFSNLMKREINREDFFQVHYITEKFITPSFTSLRKQKN